MSRVNENEPAPKAGVGCIQDLVALSFGDLDATRVAIVADIQARKELGLKKYGTVLQAFNGRNAMMDAYQEALDLVMYLRQALEEGLPVYTSYVSACELVYTLRKRLG